MFSVKDVQLLLVAARACEEDPHFWLDLAPREEYERDWDWVEQNVPRQLRDLAGRIEEASRVSPAPPRAES